MDNLTYATRVYRGARLLDERRPGWANNIDRDELILDHCDKCVLGQLYGYYFTGIEKLDLSFLANADRPDYLYGFEVDKLDEDHCELGYTVLRSLWMNEIMIRLEANTTDA